jgi:hypothetical protein
MIDQIKSSLVIKLRRVMVAAIASSMLLTLAGQPESFWRDPAKAIWANGQLIHATNAPAFDLLLAHGALVFIAVNLTYMIAAFFAVSRLPRVIALAAIFSVIFVHGYGAAMWLVMRFHFGGGAGIATCGAILGTLLSFAVLPAWQRSREAVNAWRWLMVAVLFVDFANTLLGQPASYWQDPSTMLESNSLTRMFLGRGWIYYLGLDVILAAAQFALITALPLPIAFVSVFAFIFGNFVGASNWFFFEWQWGWIAPVAYGLILGTLMVLVAFRNRDHEKVATPAPAPV